MSIYRALAKAAGRQWSVGGADADATYTGLPTEPEAATGGTVSVATVGADSVVKGLVDLSFPKAGRVRQAFTAPWSSARVLCG